MVRFVLSAESRTTDGKTEVLIATEYCPNGRLSDVALNRPRPFSPRQVLSAFQQCCRAVQHLHQLATPMVHRDIKLENFLLAADGTIKLCDFGSATTGIIDPRNMPFDKIREAEEEMERNTTPQNRSPEMLDLHKGHVIGPKADMWALGCLLVALCYGKHPFEDGQKLQILNARYKLPEQSEFLIFHDLIRQCRFFFSLLFFFYFYLFCPQDHCWRRIPRSARPPRTCSGCWISWRPH